MNGFLNIHKPEGITSFDVIRRLKKSMPPKTKIGHLGTLDPMATGVLPIAVGQATKIIPFIEDHTKEYMAQMTLGGVSDTQDAWGNITPSGVTSFEIDKLYEITKSFLGVIKQVPPMYSAVHYNGQRLYEMARKGQTVERKARAVEIFSLDVLEINHASELPVIGIKVSCSRGTYIRTLCHDIGKNLNTGAYMSKLVRTRTGIFRIEDSLMLEDIAQKGITAQNFLPMDYPLQYMYNITVDRNHERLVMNGNQVVIDDLPEGNIRIYSRENRLIAIAKSGFSGGGSIVKPVRVFK